MDINVNARKGTNSSKPAVNSTKGATNAKNTNNSNAANNNSKNANANATGEGKQGEGNSKMAMIVIIVITILLFVFVILYITFAMKSNNLKGKAIVSQPIDVGKSDSPVKIANSEFPKTVVGREYTYSFWLYLENFNRLNETNTNHYMIMYRGNDGSLQSANPIIMMDNQSNKLYVVIRTVGSTFGNGIESSTKDIISKNYFLSDLSRANSNQHLVCAIDFIPLQRWVHVAVVVDNKIVTLFVDGQIYSVKSVDEFKASRKPELDRLGKVIDEKIILDKTEGDLVIGKSSVGGRQTIDGFVGKVEFFNYAVTLKDMGKIYEQGPMPKGFLSWLGLSQYGFRSPIYNMSTAS